MASTRIVGCDTGHLVNQDWALAESGNPVLAEMAGIELHHLPTGHWPMFSRPAELAGLVAPPPNQGNTTLSSHAQ
jgi:hypothetical protein